MIEKIVEKIYFKYGVRVSNQRAWLVLILIASILLAIIFFSTNSSKKTVIPDGPNIQKSPNMPPRLKNK